MSKLIILFPGDPLTPTGGYVYNRKIAAGLVSLGRDVSMQALDASFPSPTPSALLGARELLAAIPHGQLTVLDGLALGGRDLEANNIPILWVFLPVFSVAASVT